MKKRHTLYLNPDRVKKARDFLQARMGLSLSAYINLHLAQLCSVIEGEPGLAEKKPSEMTMQEYAEALNYWLKVSDED